MIFTLEALEAKHGDALLLHYGDEGAPKLIVIDGGPAGVYKNSLHPRLEELRGGPDSTDKLKIQLAMVSHLDDDHITGLLELTNIMLGQQEGDEFAPYQIGALWLNSFDDHIEKKVKAVKSDLQTGDERLKRSADAAVASVQQGQSLRSNADGLHLLVNTPFEPLVVTKGDGPLTTDHFKPLTLTVVGPSRSLLDNLQKKWDQLVEKKGTAKSAEVEALVADYVDKSVYNLSSIVVMVECEGKRMLLTGDARGDYILEGLEGAGLLEDGKIHIDLLKLPHHGSIRDVNDDFFERITADHYVISANGKYDNPDLKTLQLLTAARGSDEYTIHMTNEVEWASEFFAEDRKGPRNYQVEIRQDPALSVRIDLGSPLS
jgi:hypothetical protein